MQLIVLKIGFWIIKDEKIINRQNFIRLIVFLRPQWIKVLLVIK